MDDTRKDQDNSALHLLAPAPFLLLSGIPVSALRTMVGADGDEENDEPQDCPQGEPALGTRQLLVSALRSRNQVMAMLSNFSTSYNAVNVGLVLPVLQYSVSDASGGGESYSSPDHQEVQRSLEDDQDDEESIVASSLLMGMIIGQLIGGFLGDWLGRRRAMVLVMILQIGGSIGSAIFVTTSESAMNELAIWRFVLGIGAGGVYPLAAVMSAEDREGDECESDEASEAGNSGELPADNQKSIESFQRIALTFATQGWGFLAVPLLAWPMLACRMNADSVWRTLLGLGALPGLLVLHLRIAGDSCSKRRGETLSRVEDPGDGQSNFVADDLSEDNEVDPDNEMALIDNSHLHGRDPNSLEFDALQDLQGENRGLWESIKSEPQLKRKLAGTAGAWFLFDVLFYGNTLFEPLVLEAAFGPGSGADGYELLQSTARDSLVISLLSLPGYFMTVLLIGRRTCTCRSLRTNSRCSAICPPIRQTPSFIQLQGFGLMFLLYLTIGLLWHRLSEVPWLLILLYASTFFFSNYGPNSTTFLLPSVTYSKECRSTLNGISAAWGKVGAIAGASLFAPASKARGEPFVMIFCGCVSLMGWLLTKFFVPLNF